MQISDSVAGRATGDSIANLAARAAGRSSEEPVDGGRQPAFRAGSYDPSEQVSLSVDALFVLSASRNDSQLPALTEDERNNIVSPELEQREYVAFRRFRDQGDMKGYYRAYVAYFDNLQPQDQASPRYAGSREVAVSALRSLAYAEKAADEGAEVPAVIDAILASGNTIRRDMPQMAPAAAAVSGARVSRAASMYLGSF